MSSLLGGLFGPKVGHKPLFDDLCQFHAIDKKTKTLLNAVVQKYQPPRPAEIFIDPAILNQALTDEEFAESVNDLEELIKQWFENPKKEH